MTEFDRGMTGTARKTIWDFAKNGASCLQRKVGTADSSTQNASQVASIMQTGVQAGSSADSASPKS
jgi:hypothetical protein